MIMVLFLIIGYINIMSEELRLLKENNLMLKAICLYLNKNIKDEPREDVKDFVSNVIANIFANNKFDVR